MRSKLRHIILAVALASPLIGALLSSEDSASTVTLYAESGTSSSSLVVNPVDVGRCIPDTAPPNAVASVNRSAYYVDLYLTLDCSGPPIMTLRPYGQSLDHHPAHGPVNSIRAVEFPGGWSSR